MKTFAQRLAEAMKDRYGERGGQSQLARAAGLSQALLSQWMNGDIADGRSVKAGHIFTVARELKVAPEWLATGAGPMRVSPAAPESASHAARPEMDKLRAAIEMVESALEELGIDYPAATKAQIVVAVYAAIEAAGVAAAAKDVVATMLKTVSQTIKT